MATVNPLEDILNSDVDPNAISAIVGSLESQLASPSIKDSSQLNPVSAVSRNHVHTQALVSHGNLSEKRTLQIANASTKIAPQQGSNTVSLTNVNGGNTIVTSQQHFTLSNCVTSPVTVSSVTSSGLLLTSSNNLQLQTSKPVMTITSSSLNSHFTPTSNLVVTSESQQGKPVTVSISGIGSDHLLPSSQNGGITRIQTVNAKANITAAGNSAIHKPAVSVVEQKPLTATAVNHTGLQDQKQTVITQGNITRPPQFVIKNDPGRSVGNLQPVMAQPVSSPHVTAALKSNPAANSNVLTLNNPHQVVVRPTYQSQSHQTTQNQIQIVSVPNSGINPRLQGVSTNPKLAARMVHQAAPVRIAPQQQQATVAAQPTTSQPRPPSSGNVGCITLPPGFQLPPGAMIVKNETGQFMVVNGSASGAGTSATTVTTQNRPVTTQVVTRPGMTTVSPVASTMGTPHQQQPIRVQQRPAVRMIRPTGPPLATSTTQAAVTRPQMRPVQRMPAQAVQSTAGAGGVPADNVKKCKNFLSTLIKLAASQPQSTVDNVTKLIQGLIDGTVEPEAFTQALQNELKSSPQPYLVPFLKKSLPLLRQSMKFNNMQIEGVRPPPASAVQRGGGGMQRATSLGAASGGSGGATASTQVTSGPRPQQAPQRLVSQPNILYQPHHGVPRQPGSAPATKHLLTKPGGFVGRQTLSGIPASQSPAATAVRDKRKYDSALKEDDDINDVATMGGVNLTEESRNILGTSSELMSTQLRTCKDTNFLYTKPLQAKLNAIAKKHGLEECPQDVISLISHATEERLRNIVSKLANIAEHRIENYKVDSRYTQSSEVRSKLKFLEELDKLEKKRHEDAEKETLMRISKSRSKNEDPEQLKLKEKAKALQAQESERLRQEEANATALLAIGPRKKRRLDDNAGSPGAGSSASGQGGNAAGAANARSGMGARPRIKRVVLRDLLLLMEQEHPTCRSSTLYRAYTK